MTRKIPNCLELLQHMKAKKHLRANTSQFYVLQTNMLSWLISSSLLFLNLSASIPSWVLANTDMCHSAQQGYVYHDSFCPKISCLAFGEGSYYFHKMWTKAQPPTFFKKNLENLFCQLDSSKLRYLCYNSDQVWIIPSNFELRTVWAVRGQSECHVDDTSHVSHRCAYRSKTQTCFAKPPQALSLVWSSELKNTFPVKASWILPSPLPLHISPFSERTYLMTDE